MNSFSRCLAILALLLPLSAASQTALQPGTYVTASGWGTLTLKPATKGAQEFELGSLGANGHTCTLEGAITAGKATLDASSGPCVVTFTLTGQDIDVQTNTEEPCREFCGMRASFTGLYLSIAPACTPQAQRQTRDQFKRLYDAKSYSQARMTLEPLLKDCGKTLAWFDEAWIRNDLALTLHKLGDDAGCRSLLKPLAEKAALTDEQIRMEWPPMEAETFLPIAKATRTNLKLCRSGGQ